MRLDKFPPEPAGLVDFFQEGLDRLGAVSERAWYDRLRVVAEGQAARLWNSDGQFVETEIYFPSIGESAPRDAEKEVFPGCPLTFHLAEALRPSTLTLQRMVLQPSENPGAPGPEVAAKLWHNQIPGTLRWKLEKDFAATWHFSLLALIRCEVQAIDQHWSAYRVAISLPDGQRDDSLARALEFCDPNPKPDQPMLWPTADPSGWRWLIEIALKDEMVGDLTAIRQRQQNYLHRELDRIEAYFQSYERELGHRLRRQNQESGKARLRDRLAAAKVEQERRRQDQIQRHEIRVIPHIDALLLLAEPAWKAMVSFARNHDFIAQEAIFVPRSRRWLYSDVSPIAHQDRLLGPNARK